MVRLLNVRFFENMNSVNMRSENTKKKIICCVCKAHFSFRQQFRDHVSENHGKIESMELKFDSVEGNVLTIFQRNIENIQLSK